MQYLVVIKNLSKMAELDIRRKVSNQLNISKDIIIRNAVCFLLQFSCFKNISIVTCMFFLPLSLVPSFGDSHNGHRWFFASTLDKATISRSFFTSSIHRVFGYLLVLPSVSILITCSNRFLLTCPNNLNRLMDNYLHVYHSDCPTYIHILKPVFPSPHTSIPISCTHSVSWRPS